ncbi:MAG TPA: hypothetical protein DEA97_07750 [Bacteroidales bacterium]|nr:hypothetical protein [Bacteroidales bacterium]
MKKTLFSLCVFTLCVFGISYGQTTVTVDAGDATNNFITKWKSGASATIKNSLLYDDGSYVGLGTTSPISKFHMYGTDFASSRLILDRYDATGSGPTIDFRGIDNGGLTASGTLIGNIGFYGESSADNLTRGAKITVSSTENWSSSAYGTKFVFSTVANGSTTLVDRFTIDHDGEIGIGTTSPEALLDVRGNAIFNDAGSNYDFRIEGDGESNLFFLDASVDMVGIGTASPSSRLSVKGAGNTSSTNAMSVKNSDDNLIIHFQDDRKVGIYSACPAAYRFSVDGDSYFKGEVTIVDHVGIGCDPDVNYELYICGDAYATGDWYSPSDKRFKKNINSISNALKVINNINGVSYEYKTSEFKDKNFSQGKKYGYIAQDLMEIVPEAVSKGADGYYSVNYTEIIPIITEAIKEQQTLITNQNEKIQQLEKEIELLKEVTATASNK